MSMQMQTCHQCKSTFHLIRVDGYTCPSCGYARFNPPVKAPSGFKVQHPSQVNPVELRECTTRKNPLAIVKVENDYNVCYTPYIHQSIFIKAELLKMPVPQILNMESFSDISMIAKYKEWVKLIKNADYGDLKNHRTYTFIDINIQ